MMRQRFAPQQGPPMMGGGYYGDGYGDYGYGGGQPMYHANDPSMMGGDKGGYGRGSPQQQQQFNPYANGNYDYTQDSMGFDESNGFAIGGGMW